MLKKIFIILILFTPILNAQKAIHKSPFYKKPSNNPIIALHQINVDINGDATTNIAPEHVKFIEKEINRATTLIHQNKYGEAIDICNNIVSYAPNYYSSYFTRGYAYEMQQDYNFALDDYKKAFSFFPRNQFLYDRLSSMYTRYNQYTNALVVLLSAYKVFRDDYSWLLLAGNVALENNDIQTADHYYMLIMKTKFKAYAYEGLGHIEKKIGRPNVAQDSYDFASYLYRTDRNIYINDYLGPYNIQRMIDNVRKLNNFENTIPL